MLILKLFATFLFRVKTNSCHSIFIIFLFVCMKSSVRFYVSSAILRLPSGRQTTKTKALFPETGEAPFWRSVVIVVTNAEYQTRQAFFSIGSRNSRWQVVYVIVLREWLLSYLKPNRFGRQIKFWHLSVGAELIFGMLLFSAELLFNQSSPWCGINFEALTSSRPPRAQIPIFK